MESEAPSIPPEIRQSYLDAVGRIKPGDEQEAIEIRKAIEWLRSASALNKPHNQDQHLGVLSVLVTPERDRTFLIAHKKAGLWLPPGGHVDFGKSLFNTAVEELYEELGISSARALSNDPLFLNSTLTQGKNAGHIDLTTWFVFEEDPTRSFSVQEKEATQGLWVPIREVSSSTKYASLHRGFQKLASVF